MSPIPAPIRRHRSIIDKRVVVIGGGTGSFNVLQAVKALTPHVTALVSMADDGGSTGTLRDELGVLPPGDVRQCLVALSDTPHLRDLFNYRFDSGSLNGHSFGNLLLTALEKQTGNFAQAVETASQVLNITGRVVPITLDNIRLVLDSTNGQHVVGEHNIEETQLERGSRPRISLVPEPKLNPEAAQAIAQADLVVIAPGDLYTSLAPALVVPGVGEALAVTRAKVIYICNLVAKPGHTDGMGVIDYASEIERFAGRPILDCVLYNTAQPSAELLRRYRKDREYIVGLHEASRTTLPGGDTMPTRRDGVTKPNYRIVGVPLLSSVPVVPPQSGDRLAATRSFIRHDIERLSQALSEQLIKRTRSIRHSRR